MPAGLEPCGDELGPKRVVRLRLPRIGLDAVVVVDNTALGVAIGGVRMAPDVTVGECARLARAMTLKNAMAGLRYGGGKAVIAADPHGDAATKETLVRGFAQLMADLRDYVPGPDMGTNETCMAWIRDECGRAVGLPRVLGGIPLDEIGATGLGLAVAAEVAAPRAGLALAGARVAIQGYGAVGRHAVRRLRERDARIVAVADSRGTAIAPDGLDLDRLDATRREGLSVTACPGVVAADREAILDVDADIWIPAARPDVLRAENVDRLRARLVLEGANIPVTAEAEARLHARGVLCIPDFVANAGGVICAAVEYEGGSEALARAVVAERIRANVTAILATMGGRTPRAAALATAEARVRDAMALHRFG